MTVCGQQTDKLGFDLKDFLYTVDGLAQLFEGGTAGDFL